MMRYALIFLLSVLASHASAQTTKPKSLENEYEARSWRAVGRIDLGRGHCSGTLIAPDLVLTAAHCLYRPGSSELVPVRDIVFHAGLRQGKAVATRRVKAAAAHASYDPVGEITSEKIRYDVGLLRLAEPIPTHEIAPFKVHRDVIRPGPVSIVSYGKGRLQTQSRQKECQFLEEHDDLFLFDCRSDPGTSGAPVFSHLNGRGAIMAVISGRAVVDGVERSFGMHLPARVEEVKRQMRIQVRAPVAKVRRLGVGDRSGGAKFVRPGGS